MTFAPETTEREALCAFLFAPQYNNISTHPKRNHNIYTLKFNLQVFSLQPTAVHI